MTKSDGVSKVHRVLVTGASGFLGQRVVRQLRQAGHTVIAHGRNKDVLEALQVPLVVGDLRALAHEDLAVDSVIHCAALSSPWGSWKKFEQVNVDGTQAVIDFAARNDVRRIVFVSSPSIYSVAADHLKITEDQVDLSNRLNYYIESKIQAEALLKTAHQNGRIPELVIIRPRGLIGAGDTSLAPRLIRVHKKAGIPLFRGGTNLVDLTAVDNAAYALRLALEAPHANGNTYNITNGEPQRIKDLLDQLFEYLGEKPRYRKANARVLYALAGVLEKICNALPHRPEPPLTRYSLTTIAYSQTLDISAAQRDLGYVPQVSLKQALKDFATQWQANADKESKQ